MEVNVCKLVKTKEVTFAKLFLQPPVCKPRSFNSFIYPLVQEFSQWIHLWYCSSRCWSITFTHLPLNLVICLNPIAHVLAILGDICPLIMTQFHLNVKNHFDLLRLHIKHSPIKLRLVWCWHSFAFESFAENWKLFNQYSLIFFCIVNWITYQIK